MAYTYDSGNKLLKVEELIDGASGFEDGSNGSTNDYAYDSNGNMLKDQNKGIGNPSNNGITYNHLNLPDEVKFENNNNKKIKYIYDATGVKLRKFVYNNSITPTTTDYAGNYVYEGSSLKFFNHPEGYVDASGSGYEYVYQYKDHLGNVRLSYKGSNGSLEILEENNYYPFGLKHKGYNAVVNSTNPALKYKFGGKEYQDELGLDWYDVSARNYDPALGRWMNIDLLAGAIGQIHNSTYAYAMNNPIAFNDPDGNCPPGINCYEAWQALKGIGRAVADFGASTWENLKTNNPRSPGTALRIVDTAISLSTAYNEDPVALKNSVVSNAKQEISKELQKGIEGSTYLAASVLLTILEPSPAGEINAASKGIKVLINGGKASEILKGVNSNLPHAVERAVERGIFKNADEASAALKNLTGEVGTNNLPNGTIIDPSKADRILVPVGEGGMAVYQVGSNGTAKLKTVLNEIIEQ